MWNPESWVVKSRIQLKESGIPLRIGIQIQACLGFPYMDWSFSLLERGGEKEALPESRQTFEVATVRTSEPVNLVLYRHTGFPSASMRLLVITVPAISRARLFSLGSKLYPSNIQQKLHKELTRFMQSLSLASQNRAGELRKVLPAVLWRSL